MSVDLISFREWIKKNGIVAENHLPYFIMWIRRYIDEAFSSEDQYAEVLYSENRADWQIRQALNAVRLFHQYSGSGSEPAEECALENPLDLLEKKLRIRHYSLRTIKVYLYWCRDFLEYCRGYELDYRSDSAYGDYLTMLALKRRVASSTQNQAFNALLFLFRNLWNREPEGIDAFRARKPKRLPVVLSREEVRSVLAGVSGVAGMVIKLCYSSGLRLSEALALRVKDVSLDRKLIVVRSGKGGKDRVTILADNMVPVLSDRLSVVKDICSRSFYPVSLPSAIHRKYCRAGSDFRWWYLFPSKNVCSDGGMKVVHHIHSTSVQSEMRRAVKQSGIGKRAGVHTLRHCFATHLLQSGVELCEIQELLGHKNLETTRIYIHLAKDLGNTVRSPLDMI